MNLEDQQVSSHFQIGADGELIFDTDYLNDTQKIIPVEDKHSLLREVWYWLSFVLTLVGGLFIGVMCVLLAATICSFVSFLFF